MSFPPDYEGATRLSPSPNHGERRGALDMILLHYTGMASATAALDRLCAAGSGVSAHYVVFENADVVQCVPETRRAWHAGESFWAGERDINSRSIGIEIANPGHDFGYPDFPETQIEAVIALCRDIIARRRIAAERVLAHSDVAPARKQDPGEKFPWARLHAHGVGLWTEAAPDARGPTLCAGDAGAAVRGLQERLARFGYGIEATARYDAATEHVVTAFQRHFRPARVDGIADAETAAILIALLRQVARP